MESRYSKLSIPKTPREIRDICSMTQSEMAKELGMSREHYARIEKDSVLFRKSRIAIALKMCDMANITLNEMDYFY